jgi:hypothetical protein
VFRGLLNRNLLQNDPSHEVDQKRAFLKLWTVSLVLQIAVGCLEILETPVMEYFLSILLLFSVFQSSLAWHNAVKHPQTSKTHAHSHSTDTSRLVMYVQTFKTPDKQQLSLLPLIEKHTQVTHIILASLHLHDVPGEIRLNDDRLESPIWDDLWHEVWLLRQNGIKVMALLGGAAGGTYKRLNGTDAQVSFEKKCE